MWGQTPRLSGGAQPEAWNLTQESAGPNPWSFYKFVILSKVRRQPNEAKNLPFSSDRRPPKPPPQRPHQFTIYTLRHHLHRRISSRPCQVQRHSQKRDGDRKIRPRVQTPLTMPRERPGRERRQIRNRPLISIRSSRSQQILEQVQMKSKEAQDRRLPPLASQRKGNDAHRHCERQIVKRMVILREPQQRMRRIAGQYLRNNSQTIHIRNHCRKGNQRPIPLAAHIRGVSEHPSRQEVRDGTHARSLRT
jgi:hypothetical protein